MYNTLLITAVLRCTYLYLRDVVFENKEGEMISETLVLGFCFALANPNSKPAVTTQRGGQTA